MPLKFCARHQNECMVLYVNILLEDLGYDVVFKNSFIFNACYIK